MIIENGNADPFRRHGKHYGMIATVFA
jgi:hypothetical protein